MSQIHNPFGETTNHGVVQQAVKGLISESNDQVKRIAAIEEAIKCIEAAIAAHPTTVEDILNIGRGLGPLNALNPTQGSLPNARINAQPGDVLRMDGFDVGSESPKQKTFWQSLRSII